VTGDPDALRALHAAVWHELERAAGEPGHAWRTAVLATVGSRAGAPCAEARSVVLREADAATQSLVFYTDARSPKAAELLAAPLGTLCMWSPALQWQVRCACRFDLATDGPAVERRWQALQATSAAGDYRSALPPGADLAAEPGAAVGAAWFAVVTATVTAIDWLELNRAGHHRARLAPGGDSWLQP
jgi:pyridoxamine 5'-phosphate oxidase